MQFRRSGPRDERRRRVLMDPSRREREVADESSADEQPEQASTPRVRYGQSAQRSQQPPITDFIPKRRFHWACLVGAGLCLIAVVQSTYGALFVLRPDWPQWSAFDPYSAGSLARWLNASILLLGAAACVMTFAIRRHRIDDYRGGYRYWLWAAAAFVLGSIDSSCALHGVVAYLIEQPPVVGALAVWLSVGSVLLFMLTPETINSRLAAWSGGLAFLAYGLAAAAIMETMGPINEPLTVMVASGSEMLGHLAITTAVGFYVRYVYLDAHDLLPAPSPRAERAQRRREERLAARQAAREEAARRKAEQRQDQEEQRLASREEKTQAKQEAAQARKQAKAAKAEAKADARANAKAKNRAQVGETTETEAETSGSERKSKRQRKAQRRQTSETETSRAEPEVQSENQESAGDDDEMQHLSKAERRRLRKLKRRQQKAA